MTALIVTRHDPGNAPSITAATGGSVLYAEFGPTEDTIYLADPANPADRHRLFALSHGQDYGIVGAVSPDGTMLAYTALPAGSKPGASSPDQPADVWLVDIAPDAKPRRLIEAGVDLLVAPKWSDDSSSFVIRRTTPSTGSALMRVDLSGSVANIASDFVASLFPVHYEGATGTLYYVAVGQSSSDLYVIEPGIEPSLLVHLADGLTRDWTLSTDMGYFAFLLVETGGGRFVTYPYVVCMTCANLVPTKALIDAQVESFGPAWRPDGSLSLGRPVVNGTSRGVLQTTSYTQRNGAGTPVPDAPVALAAPQRGFDVPLAWSADSQSLAVRTFDGTSAQAPGRASLAVVSRDGARHTIATGEVTFLGWINP